MLEELLLPDASFLQFENYAIQDQVLVFSLSTTQPEAVCPYCETPSQRVNDRYRRKPADLPCLGYAVRLDLTIRRFFCENDACDHCTFAERLPTVVAPYARRTHRLAETQQDVAYEVGGELGARLLTLVRMNISADTVLSLIRDQAEPDVYAPRVLGVDDWALSKGQTYGTILVDLEGHRVVDLLPDRCAEVLRNWLQTYPGVEIISRDRGGDYIKGATEGAPNAVQVADRWHLLKNLKDALVRLLERKIACLQAVAEQDEKVKQDEKQGVEVAPTPEMPVLTQAEQDKQARRLKRQARYDQVKQWHEQGFSKRHIARQFGMHPQTVAKYIQADSCPLCPEGRRHSSKLDPFLSYLQKRWAAGYHNASGLWREIRKLGFSGSRGLVARWAAKQRQGSAEHPDQPPDQPRHRPYQRPLTPSRAVWLFLKTADTLSLDEQETLQTLIETDADLAQAYTLAQSFALMVRKRQSVLLEPWLIAVASSAIGSLKRFANSLQQDLAAVKAGLSLVWSNGQVEGQINRLKMIKRQMYGRANFDLLRKRVLPKANICSQIT